MSPKISIIQCACLRSFILLCLLMFLISGYFYKPVVAQSGQTYYVATTGDDNNPGTLESPFGTIQHGISLAGPGDTVYVRDGTYHESIQITTSGSEGNPIRILAYSDEQPVIDGQYLLPAGPPATPSIINNPPIPPEEFVWTPLVRIRGNYIEFSGFDVIRSRGRGITIHGVATDYNHEIVISDCVVNGARNAGIFNIYTEDVLIERCVVTDAGNYAPYARSPFVLNWPVIVNMRSSRNVTLRETRIHHNWGEGIAAGRDSEQIAIEDNLIYNNFALQVYIHRSQQVTVTRNLVYHTNEQPFQRGGDPSQCIVVNNENNFPNSLSVDQVLISNNVIVGCRWLMASWGSGSTTPIANVTIEHNTLVNAYSNNGPLNATALNVADANLTNMNIRRNLISQQNFLVADVVDNPEVVLSENAWSSTPPAEASGAGDWIGDPQLENPNAPLLPGKVEANWYQLSATSPLYGSAFGPYATIVNAATTGCDSWPLDGCPPAAPVMISPLGGVQEQSPTFIWQTATGQSTGAATSYTLVIYRVDTASIAHMETYTPAICISGTCSAQPAGLTLPPGEYLWLVQAYNAYGASPWSIYSP